LLEHLDPLILARAQFAFTVSFHFLFPAFTIGLASYLLVLEAPWLKTGKGVYANLYRYWLKIFAVVFGMGVVSGVVMSYQFGTNWSVFSTKAGPVIGPLMTYEVMTAFFLEAGFLGVMLFGISRVGKGVHFLASCMVALGTLISATWIIAANSWMQTPVGYAINAKGQFVPVGSWWPIIFNPSFPYRLVHTVIACFLTTALLVGGVGARHLLKDRANPGARTMFSMAMEGDYHPSPDGAPLILFGLPSNEQARVLYEVSVPHIGSLILKHDPDAPLEGLTDFPLDQWPPARANTSMIGPGCSVPRC
jgi:cytochrome d ubiquinol oxidase subunit I